MKRPSCWRTTVGARFALLAAGLLMGTASASADWPLVWDLDGRGDEPMAARLGAGGDLWVLSESYLQGQGSPRAVLLRVAPDGGIVWATADPELIVPTALALRDDGSALAIGFVKTALRLTAFTATGEIAWSRSRSDLALDNPFNGPHAAPIWDPGAGGPGGGGAWRIPCGLGGDFAVISFGADGAPLPDVVWSPPAGEARANSVLPRSGGGLLVAGQVENIAPPGWWTVALDAAGAEVWKHFDDGGTPAGVFSGAFLLSADPVRVFADDETFCGLFSLRLWALDAATGAPLWDATWPPNDSPTCNSFILDSVILEGDRIVASGVGDVASVGASFAPLAATFDAASRSVRVGASLRRRDHRHPRRGRLGGRQRPPREHALSGSELQPDAALARRLESRRKLLRRAVRGAPGTGQRRLRGSCPRGWSPRLADDRLRLQRRRRDRQRPRRAAGRRPLRRALP